MPQSMYALVKGVRGYLVARPSPGSPRSGDFPRYAGMRFLAPEDMGGVDLRKNAEKFEPVEEIVAVDKPEAARLKRAAALGELEYLGDCIASSFDAAAAALSKNASKAPARPGKGGDK